MVLPLLVFERKRAGAHILDNGLCSAPEQWEEQCAVFTTYGGVATFDIGCIHENIEQNCGYG